MRAHIDTEYGNLGGNAEFFVPDMQLCIAGIFYVRKQFRFHSRKLRKNNYYERKYVKGEYHERKIAENQRKCNSTD